MRAQGKIRELFNEFTGKVENSRYPKTREEALVEDVAKFYPMTTCPEHGERAIHFTVSGVSACCANRNAVDEYNAAVRNGEPLTIHDAQAQGKNYFWTPLVNPYCGHPGKSLFSGRCVFCAEEKANNPRQTAIRNKQREYMPLPNDPCPNGHVALRRVDNGSCAQCRAEMKEANAPELSVRKAFPDLVISREEAKSAGFKVYRTGKPCKHGHTGWRYLSTNACITCKEGN